MNKNVNLSQDTCNLSAYVDRLSKSMGANRDSEGLGVMSMGRFLIGGVGAINGADGEEIPEFVATRHELKELAKYWFSERIEVDFDWFLHQCTGSSEWRWSKYISRRLNRLAEILGAEEMQKAWDAAVESFRKGNPKVTDDDWNIFRHGTEDEQEAWRVRVYAETEALRDVRQCASDGQASALEMAKQEQ